MKLKLNIFLVLLAVLLFSCLGSNIQEGFGLEGDIDDLGDDLGRGVRQAGQGLGDVVGGVVDGVGDVVGGGVRGLGDVVGGVGQGIDDALGLGYAGDYYYDRGTGSYGDRYPYSRDRYPYPRSPYPIIEYEERPQWDPRENDDKWIRKSQIVPPVCPKCPDVRTCRQTPCPACPPCGRCPDPAFTCEKVPNYKSRAWMGGSSGSSSYSGMGGTGGVGLPRPILGDFSTFGM